MKAKKVLSGSNLPAKLPLWSSLTTAIALDYWNAPEWLWGCLGLLFLLAWIAWIIGIATQEKVDLFEEVVDKQVKAGSKFADKLKNAMKMNEEGKTKKL